MSVTNAGRYVHRAFEWIESVAVDVHGGLGWLEDGQLYDDLYSGTAGVLLGCAEAAAYGIDTARVAEGAASRLLHLIERAPAATMPDDGLFSGWAGVAVALRAWSAVTGDSRAAAGAAEVTAQIAGRVPRAPFDPARCTDVISGDAGILLALLADDSAFAAANCLADRLVQVAEPGPDGLQWRMAVDGEFLMPGFSHGTAGVAYALAVAGHRLDRPDLITVAAQGAEALLALGHSPDGWAVPLAIPARPSGPSVNFGWCHGPTGTVRLFLALDAIDPQPRWQHAAGACVKALRNSGLPARLRPGFWDNVARCCGTAGVGQLVLDRYQDTGMLALLDWADILATDVLDRSITSARGVTWSNTEHTRTPSELPPEPGFMHGAAGIAGWLARLDALHTDRGTARSPVGPGLPWL